MRQVFDSRGAGGVLAGTEGRVSQELLLLLAGLAREPQVTLWLPKPWPFPSWNPCPALSNAFVLHRKRYCFDSKRLE